MKLKVTFRLFKELVYNAGLWGEDTTTKVMDAIFTTGGHFVIYSSLQSVKSMYCYLIINNFFLAMVPRYSCTNWALMYEGSFYKVEDTWLKHCAYGPGPARGNLTIQMYGQIDKALKRPVEPKFVHDMPAASSFQDRQSKDLVLFSNKIFTERFETDVEIVSADGSKHPCHKIFLTGNTLISYFCIVPKMIPKCTF